jgi:vacuolar-type H+-ATPase subunit I/STV1
LNFLGSLSSLSRLSISQGATISQGAILWYFSIQLFTNHRFRVGIMFGIVCSPPQNLCVWVGNVLHELVVLLC